MISNLLFEPSSFTLTTVEAALRDDPENGKMYEFGVQMFLQHHITSEPYGSKDKVISINLGDSKK